MGSAADGGLSPSKLQSMEAAVRTGPFTKIGSVLIARNGKLVYEAYFDGDANTRRDTRSATKSITDVLVGIAIHDKKLSGVDARVLSLLPERAGKLQNPDPRKAVITVEADLHLVAPGGGPAAGPAAPATRRCAAASRTRRGSPPSRRRRTRRVRTRCGTGGTSARRSTRRPRRGDATLRRRRQRRRDRRSSASVTAPGWARRRRRVVDRLGVALATSPASWCQRVRSARRVFSSASRAARSASACWRWVISASAAWALATASVVSSTGAPAVARRGASSRSGRVWRCRGCRPAPARPTPAGHRRRRSGAAWSAASGWSSS